MTEMKFISFLGLMLITICQSFTHPNIHKASRTTTSSSSALSLTNRKKNNPREGFSSKGFGNNMNIKNSNEDKKKTTGFSKVYEKTYDQTSFLTTEAMEGNMNDFFKKNTDWHPLFAYIATNSNVPASKYVKMIASSDKHPWVDLPSMPSGPDKEKHMQTIAHVLDKTQMAMLDIPDEDDDDGDLNFIEEGRRILVLNRFHVVQDELKEQGDHDELFRTCWSEIYSLVHNDLPKTGSLIILDDMENDVDLNNFVHENIRMPLEWLGIRDDHIEVAHFTRGRQCIRLIYRLGDIPDLEERDRALKEERRQDEMGVDEYQ
jgi:hypothetical protein